MRTIVWALTVLLVLLWSGLAWVAYELVGVGGNLVASNADIVPVDPMVIEWASWLATAGTGVGEWLVVAIWAFVSLILMAVAYVITRLLPRQPAALQRR